MNKNEHYETKTFHEEPPEKIRRDYFFDISFFFANASEQITFFQNVK